MRCGTGIGNLHNVREVQWRRQDRRMLERRLKQSLNGVRRLRHVRKNRLWSRVAQAPCAGPWRCCRRRAVIAGVRFVNREPPALAASSKDGEVHHHRWLDGSYEGTSGKSNQRNGGDMVEWINRSRGEDYSVIKKGINNPPAWKVNAAQPGRIE